MPDTDIQIVKPENAIMLGGDQPRTYILQRQPIAITRTWRKRFTTDLKPIAEALGLIGDPSHVGLKVNDLLKSLDVANIAHAFASLLPVIMDSYETMFDLLCFGHDQIAKDREWIEQNAYDDEVAAAFVTMLKHMYAVKTLSQAVR